MVRSRREREASERCGDYRGRQRHAVQRLSLTVDGVWKAGVWAPTVWADGVWREGDAPEPPGPPPPPADDERFSGGFLASTRRRSQEELERDRQRFGLAAEVIQAVAERQAEAPQPDAQKKLEELTRELALRRLEWRAEYLEELNARRERLIQERQDEQTVLMLLALVS
jgi:hypothetical protein